MCLCLILFPPRVSAIDTKNTEELKFFDIPKLPLHQAILEFAFQADIEIIAQQDDLKEQWGNAVFGYFTPSRALQRLVRDASLSVTFLSESQAYVVHAASIPPPPRTLPDSPPMIQEVIVTGTRFPVRYHTIVNSEDRFGTTIFDSSRAHNILPDVFLRDSSSDSLTESLRYISSATAGDGLLNSNDDYFIRGFERKNTYINGLRLTNNSAAQILPDTIERVDVLKGPSMLFYGQSSAGGVVDITRKLPERNDQVRLATVVNTTGRQKLAIEAHKGDFLASGLNISAFGVHDAVRDKEENQKERQLINVRGRGQYQDRYRWDLGYEYQTLDKTTASNLPIFSKTGQFLPFKVRDFIYQAQDNFVADITLVDGSMSTNITPKWQLQGAFLLQREIRDGVRINEDFLTDTHVLLAGQEQSSRADIASIMGQMAAPVLRAGNNYTFGTIESLYDQYEKEHSRSLSCSLSGRFKVAKIEHHLIVGADIYSQHLHQQFAVEERAFSNPPVFSGVSLEFAQDELIHALIHQPSQTLDINRRFWELKRYDWGQYLQLRSNWTDTWSTSLGWRYSRFDDARRDIGGSNPDLRGSYDGWITQGGSSLLLTENVSIYGNYSETLNLNYLIDDFGRFVERPETSRQQELGAKWQRADGKVLGTIAVFNIESSGANELSFVSGYRTLLSPRIHDSQGIEVDLSWKVNESVEWLANIALMQSRTPTSGGEIRYPRHVADNIGGLFGRFSLTNDWKVFLGANYVSERAVDVAGNLKLGEQVVINVSLEKSITAKQGVLTVRATAKNIFDEYQPSFAAPGFRANPNDGRSFSLELSHRIKP